MPKIFQNVKRVNQKYLKFNASLKIFKRKAGLLVNNYLRIFVHTFIVLWHNHNKKVNKEIEVKTINA